MTDRRLFLERHVERINGLLLALLLGSLSVRWGSVLLGGLAVVVGLVAFLDTDFETPAGWWISLAWHGAGAVWIVSRFLKHRVDLLTLPVDGWIVAGVVACVLTQVVLLLTGRWRRVWSFARRGPR